MSISPIKLSTINLIPNKTFGNFLNRIQTNVYMIAALIFGFVVIAGYAVYRCFFKKKHLDDKTENRIQIKNPVKKNVSKSKVTYPPITSSSDSVKSEIYKNSEAFKAFLFSAKEQSSKIKTLLENTVCKGNFPQEPIVFHHFSISTSDFKKVLNEQIPMGDNPIKVTTSSELFQYDKKGHFYPDFGHPTSFGGAYRTFGCVQEERMFAEFPVLPILDYEKKGDIHLIQCVENEKFPPNAKAAPFIIESICRQFNISEIPYGADFLKIKENELKEKIIDRIKKVENQIPVNIIGIAAVDFRGIKNPAYNINSLLYHLEAVYVAFLGAKEIAKKQKSSEIVVHTSDWGCGAFLNSKKMMVAIQCLAAEMAGVDLAFHFVRNDPQYSHAEITERYNEIRKWLEEGKSPAEILNILTDRASDPNFKNWAPTKE